MTAPKRVQLSRKRGWRMPDNTVKVDRSTRWGNPFGDTEGPSWRSAAVEAFRLENHRRPPSDFAELRGKDLACWCPLDGPCHADVLLELANRHELTAAQWRVLDQLSDGEMVVPIYMTAQDARVSVKEAKTFVRWLHSQGLADFGSLRREDDNTLCGRGYWLNRRGLALRSLPRA